MKKLANVMIVISLSASSMALAAPQYVGSFEDIRAACQNPKQFHNQIAPTNVQVSCKEVRTKWIPDASSSHTLDTSRKITIQVNSDKYISNVESAPVPSEQQNVGCPSYKETLEAIETVRAVTCDELLAFKGNAAEFCLETIENLIKQNPEALNVQATGRVFNTCSSDVNPSQEPSKSNQGSLPQDQTNAKSKKVKKTIFDRFFN